MKKILLVFLGFLSLSCETRDPDPVFFEALIYTYTNQWKEAIKKATEATEIDNRHLGSYILRATAYFSLENYEACVKDCDRILEIDETESVAYVLRADANYRLSKFADALQDYEKAATLQPQSFWQMHILRQKANLHLEKDQQAACKFWQDCYQQYGDYQSLSFLSAYCP